MQRKFEAKLQRKKSQMATTQVKEFNFSKLKQQPLERDFVNEAPPQIDKPPALPKRRPANECEPYEKVVK